MTERAAIQLGVEGGDQAAAQLRAYMSIMKSLESAVLGTGKTAEQASTSLQKIEKSTAGVSGLAQQMKVLEQSVGGVAGRAAILTNVWDAAFTAVRKTVEFATSGLTKGLGFNSMIEDTQNGIAAIVSANQRLVDSQGNVVAGTRAVEFAMQQARKVQADLKVDALQTNFSFQQLVETFQSAVGPGMAAGVKSIDGVRQVAVMAAQAMQALKIPAVQGAQEIRALFSGEQGPDNRLNQTLRITKAQLEDVRKAGGDVAEFLKEKLKPYADAAAMSTQNLSVIVSNLGDALDQALGEAAKPLFDVLKSAAGGIKLDGFQGALNEIGESLAVAARAAAPLLESIVGLGLAVVKAGTSFLSALGPVAPALKVIIDFVAGVIGKFGDWIIVIWLAQKAYMALAAAAVLQGAAGAIASLKVGMVLLLTGVLDTVAAIRAIPAAMAVASASGVAAGLAVAAAWAGVGLVIAGVVYAAKLVIDLRKEHQELEASTASLATATATAMDQLVAKFPEASKEVDALRTKLKATTDPDDVRKLNAEWLTLQRTYITMKGSLTATPIPAPVDTKVAEEMEKQTAKLKAALATLGTPEALRGISKAREEGAALIAQIKRDYPEGEKRAALLGLAMKTMAADVAEAQKKFSADSAIEAFKGIAADQTRARESAESFTKTLEEQAKVFNAVTDEGAIMALAFRQIEVDQEKVRAKQAELNGELELMGSIAPATIAQLRSAYQAMAALTLNDPSSTVGQGLQAGLLQVFAQIPTAAESAANAVRDVWAGMARAFDELFFDVLTGRFDDLKDVLKGFSDSIMRSVSNYLSDLLQRYVATLLDAQKAASSASGGSGGGDAGSIAGLAGGVLGAGAVGYGVGSAVGQFGGGQYNSTGAQIGGVLGAVAVNAATYAYFGTSAGPWGTLIGAVIGAVVGLVAGMIASSSTEKTVPFWGEKLTKDQKNMTRGVGADMGGFIADLAKTGGFGRDQRGALAGGANDIMAWFFQNMRFSAHAGSPEDLDKDIARLFNEVIPRELLHQMFGNRATNDLGNPGYAGITGATRYDDSVAEGAPITAMLRDLGVSFEKIRDISRKIDTQDPKKFMEFLSGFVGVLAGMKDIKEKFAMSGSELMNDIRTEGRKGPLDGIREQVLELQDLFGAITLYSEDQQIAKGKEAVEAARSFFDKVRQYAQQLMRAGEEFASSVGSQLQRMRDMFKNREWMADDLRRGITEIMFGSYESGSGSMIGVSAEKGIELARQAQAYIQQLFDLLAQRLADITALASDIDSLRAKFGLSAGDRNFEASGGNQSLGVTGLANMAAAINAKVREAATLTGDAQLAKIAEIRDAASEMYDYHLSLLRSIADGIREITASIDEQIRGIRWDAVTESYQNALKKMREADNPADAARYKADAERIRAGQVDELQAQYEALMAQIRGSQNPEEIRRLTAQAQGIMRTYLGLFDGEEVDASTRQAARDFAAEQLRLLGELSTGALAALGDAINEMLDDMVPGLNEIGGALQAQMSAVKAEMERLAAQLLLLNQRVQEFVDRGVTNATNEMNKLVPAVIAATGTFTEFSGEVAGGTTSIDDFGDATDVATGKVDRFGRALDRISGFLEELPGTGGRATTPASGGSGGNPSAIGTALSTIRRTPQLMRGYTG